MPIYRGATPLKAYKGDMQPVNVYRGSTKVAGWHSASYSGTSPLTVDCDYNIAPDALVIDGKCVQVVTVQSKNLFDKSTATAGYSLNADGMLIADVNAKVSAQIPVMDDQAYTWSGTATTDSGDIDMFVCQYKADGTFFGSWRSYNARTVVFDTLTAFVRISVPNEKVDTLQIEKGSRATSYVPFVPNSPSPDYPAPISTVTGDMTITGADGAVSDAVTVALGSNICASLPDGTHDSYDAVTGVLTKRVGKYVGASGTSWTISDAATSASFMSDRIPAGIMDGQTVTASATCVPTIYYKLATPTTVQLTPHLPVVRTGIKTLSIGADVVPTLSATVKSMESAITSITQG